MRHCDLCENSGSMHVSADVKQPRTKKMVIHYENPEKNS